MISGWIESNRKRKTTISLFATWNYPLFAIIIIIIIFFLITQYLAQGPISSGDQSHHPLIGVLLKFRAKFCIERSISGIVSNLRPTEHHTSNPHALTTRPILGLLLLLLLYARVDFKFQYITSTNSGVELIYHKLCMTIVTLVLIDGDIPSFLFWSKKKNKKKNHLCGTIKWSWIINLEIPVSYICQP